MNCYGAFEILDDGERTDKHMTVFYRHDTTPEEFEQIKEEIDFLRVLEGDDIKVIKQVGDTSVIEFIGNDYFKYCEVNSFYHKWSFTKDLIQLSWWPHILHKYEIGKWLTLGRLYIKEQGSENKIYI